MSGMSSDRLPKVIDIQEQNTHQSGKQEAYQEIGEQAAPQGLSGGCKLPVTIKAAHNGG